LGGGLISLPTCWTRTKHVVPISKWGKCGDFVLLSLPPIGRRKSPSQPPLNTGMRYIEIIGESSSPLVRVSNANKRSADASRAYQAKLQTIHGREIMAKAQPPGPVRAERQRTAHEQRERAKEAYQDALAASEASRASALKSGAARAVDR
jgi:hypothetical protein